MKPPRRPADSDQDYEGLCLLADNQGWTNADLAAATGRTKASVDMASSPKRGNWRARIAEAVSGGPPPKTPVDPTAHAVNTVSEWLGGLTPAELKGVDVARILDAVRELRSGAVAPAPLDWAVAGEADIVRGLTSDLPPMNAASAFDVRRLTPVQREAFYWLWLKGKGEGVPWRQANEDRPDTPVIAEPPFTEINGNG